MIINDPQALAIATECEATLAQTKLFTVSDAAQYQQAASDLIAIKKKAAELEAQRVKLKAPVIAAARAIDDFFAKPKKFLGDAIAFLDGAMATYRKAEQAELQAAQNLLDDAVRKERELIQKQAEETVRKAAEKAAELKRQADEAAAEGRADEARKLSAKAEAIITKADDKAALLNSQAMAIPTQVAVAYVPKIAGLSVRPTWKARVLDARLVPREYMEVNQTMLDKLASATKGKVSVPGVEFYSEEITARTRVAG